MIYHSTHTQKRTDRTTISDARAGVCVCVCVCLCVCARARANVLASLCREPVQTGLVVMCLPAKQTDEGSDPLR